MGRRGSYLSIGQVADIIGVSVVTIRSWEQRYGWPDHDRSPGSHRRYRFADERSFRAVARLRRSMTTRDAIEWIRGYDAE